MSEEPRLADKLWEKIVSGKFRESPRSPAMDFKYSEPSISPCLILDKDNGLDFTFKGMGLRGNRDKYVSYKEGESAREWLANEYARQKRDGIRTGEKYIFKTDPITGEESLTSLERFEEKI